MRYARLDEEGRRGLGFRYVANVAVVERGEVGVVLVVGVAAGLATSSRRAARENGRRRRSSLCCYVRGPWGGIVDALLLVVVNWEAGAQRRQ